MSSYRVLSEVSQRLKNVLWEGIASEGDLHPVVVPSSNVIVFNNPTETFREPGNRLSIWLYRIEENEFIKNAPRRFVSRPSRNGGGAEEEILDFPPLGLDLTYLITPVTGEPVTELLLLGRVMQILYDNAILSLSEPTEEVQEELRIILGRISLEELTRIWEALNEPYRLSVCYRVRVTRVRSRRDEGAALIINSRRDYDDASRGGPIP